MFVLTVYQWSSSEVTGIKITIYPSQSIKEIITQVQEDRSLHASFSKQGTWALLFNGQVLFTNGGYQNPLIIKRFQQLILEFNVKDGDTFLCEEPIEVRLKSFSGEGMFVKK